MSLCSLLNTDFYSNILSNLVNCGESIIFLWYASLKNEK